MSLEESKTAKISLKNSKKSHTKNIWSKMSQTYRFWCFCKCDDSSRNSTKDYNIRNTVKRRKNDEKYFPPCPPLPFTESISWFLSVTKLSIKKKKGTHTHIFFSLLFKELKKKIYEKPKLTTTENTLRKYSCNTIFLTTTSMYSIL